MPRAKIDPATQIIQKFSTLSTGEAGMLLKFLSVHHESRLHKAASGVVTPKVRAPRAPKPAAPIPPAPAGALKGVPKTRKAAGYAAGTPAPVITDTPAEG